jgi:hypothetical protein
MPGHKEEDVRKAREADRDLGDGIGMGGTGRTGDIGAGGAPGDQDAVDRADPDLTGVGGLGDTGMTDAEYGGSQNRMTPGIGAGDQTDEEIQEDR